MSFSRGARTATCVTMLAVVALLGTTVSSGASTAPSSGSPTSAPDGKGFELSEPFKITFLWEIVGESANAIDDFQNAAEMAVDEINANGGVGGKRISADRVTYDPLDPQRATANFLTAAEGDPDLIIGFPGPSVAAVIPRITTEGIPVLGVFEEAATNYGPNSGSEWYFNMSQKTDSAGTNGAQFVLDELNKKKVGLMGTDESYGLTNMATSRAVLKKAGLKPFAVRKVSPAATDLTPQVLAMKGSDALLNWSYPNVLAAQMNESLQNDISVPTVGGTAALIAASYKLIEPEALSLLYGVTYCDPAASNASAPLKEFVQKYEEEYGAVPSNYGPLAYDAVHLAVAAVNSAKSTSADDIQKALRTVNYKKGVCVPSYHADPAQILIHQNQVSHFAEDGSSEVVATYQIPPTNLNKK